MTNLENYFGIRFNITKELDPFAITKLEQKARDLATIIGFDIEEFFVYVHKISIVTRESHFSRNILLSNKLDKLSVEFSANPTQIRKSLVKFYNVYIDHNDEVGIEDNFSHTAIKRIYNGEMLSENVWLKTTLITYIKKDLIKRYRQIKMNVEAIPTKKFESILKKKNKIFLTQIDLRLDEKIRLNLRNLKPSEIETIRKSLVKINKDKKMEENKNFNLTPTIHAKNVIANFASGDNAHQTQHHIHIDQSEQVYEDLKKFGIEQAEIDDLKKLMLKKDKPPIHKKIFNWVGKVTQKLIEKGIDLEVPTLLAKVHELL